METILPGATRPCTIAFIEAGTADGGSTSWLFSALKCLDRRRFEPLIMPRAVRRLRRSARWACPCTLLPQSRRVTFRHGCEATLVCGLCENACPSAGLRAASWRGTQP